MTVYTIDTAFQYPTPDMNKFHVTREDLNYKIRTLSNLYLPVLSEELNSLQQEVNATDTQALRTLTLVPTALQTTEIQEFTTVIENLQRQSPTEAQQEAIDSFYGEIKSLIHDATARTFKYSTELNNSLTNLKSVSLTDNRHRIIEIEASIDKVSQQFPALNDAIEQLTKSEASLTDAINIIESTDNFSLIKNLFLSVEKLTELKLSAPQLELVKAGISAGIKILGLIDSSIKYDNLIAARRQVQTQLDDRRSQLTRINNEVTTLQQRKRQLNELQTVRTSREAYTNEINTLAESLNKFLEIIHFDAADELKPVVKRFIEQSKVYSTHLNKLRSEWRR
ncbi:alpha-xenorhabdolysin family binary toxin subunit B [Pseudomonas sp. NFX224]|uniref:alpha-xenorhabdolysin family binary toxin subunit B n=1 Tax=Pseudomonas sp. NFX224 TaxID=3402862 RepID=UPI003AFB54E2